MNKKKVIMWVLIIFVICSIFGAAWILRTDKTDHDFVFDTSSHIKLKDIETYFQYVDFNKENAKDYFKDDVVNGYTIKFFMFLDSHFKEFNNEKDLFDNVYRYLHASLSAATADQLFDLYKKFVHYQRTLDEKFRNWGMPKTTEEAVAFLHQLQDYRREIFGREIADILFGASVKAEEYPLRRGAILADTSMYGAEKEKKLKQLNEEMWGDEADRVDAYAEPFIQYKEKLAMYAKDLSDMSEEGKKAKIRMIREEIFTPEQVQSLEEVDEMIAQKEKMDQAYKTKESEIMNDASLENTEKENRIRELQDQMYGKEADALRRRLAIERASPAAWKK